MRGIHEFCDFMNTSCIAWCKTCTANVLVQRGMRIIIINMHTWMMSGALSVH